MNPAVMPTYGRTDVQFVRGEGAWLIDHHGERYLDALSGLGVVALGHANEAVALALTHQSCCILLTFIEFLAKSA
jgi:acetylornithine/N-succinyldiaminopimelate aminotransferase